MTGPSASPAAATGGRIVVEIGRVVLHGVPEGRARTAVAAFERVLRDGAQTRPTGGEPAVEAGRAAARRVWDRIEEER